MLWTATMLALDLIDRRTMWRDYWIEWGLAALLLWANETAEWWAATIMSAPMPYALILPPLLIAIFTFPIAAWLAAVFDRWRLGR